MERAISQVVKPVLMVQLHPSTFVLRDEAMLRSFGPVKVFRFRKHKGLGVILELFRQVVFLLRHLWSCRIVYIWFADFHAVLPALVARLTGRKCVVVIGGVDAAYIPELQYGTKTRLVGQISVWLTTRLAHVLLPVSQFTLSDLRRNLGDKLVEKAEVVYNCYTPDRIISPAYGSRNLVLTIAMASSVRTLRIKGVDLFLETARRMPNVRFLAVGLSGEALREAQAMASTNVELMGPVSFVKLGEIYARTRVICQFSRQESFGIALLEGLAAGCVPVITRWGGPAEVFTGVKIPAIDVMDAEKAAAAIEEALCMPFEMLETIQQKILPAFDCTQRSKRLHTLVQKLSTS